MKRDLAKIILALLGSVSALAFLYFVMTPSPPRVNPQPHKTIGQVMAEQVAKLVGPGGRIALIVRDTTVFKNPATDYQRAAFCDAVGKAKMSVNTTNLIKEDPLRVVRVPPGDFFEILRKHASGDVIVSFMGPPVLTQDQRKRLGERAPRIVALCTGNLPKQINLKQLFEQDMLHAAIIHRPHPAPVLPKNPGDRALFDHFFQIITADNLAELPVPAEPETKPTP